MAEAPVPASLQAERRFLTFPIGEKLYAVAAEAIKEVVRLSGLARVPQAPRSLLGLANLRGQVVPVASVRALLGGAPEDAAFGAQALVLAGEAPAALMIGVTPALVTAGAADLQSENIAASPGEKLLALLRTGSGVARVLDVAALLGAAFAPRARASKQARLSQAQLSERRNDAADDRRRIISFVVAGQDFAFDLEEVREIVAAPDFVAHVPHSEDLVLGVAAYRDGLLPILSLSGLLGLGIKPGAAMLVCHVGGALVGLVVDRMAAIHAIADMDAEPPPAVLAARAGGETQIKAIYRAGGGRRLISILAPELLFREDVMRGLTQTREGVRAPESRAEDEGERRQFLAFRLGEDEFALAIEAVEEVAQAPAQITRLPKTPDFLEGVANLRGEVTPIVDQRRRFGMAPLADRDRRRLIVVKTLGLKAGLIVDGVSEVLTTYKEIDPAPDLSGQEKRLVIGVVNLENTGRMIMVLDAEELLTRTERGLVEDALASTAP